MEASQKETILTALCKMIVAQDSSTEWHYDRLFSRMW